MLKSDWHSCGVKAKCSRDAPTLQHLQTLRTEQGQPVAHLRGPSPAAPPQGGLAQQKRVVGQGAPGHSSLSAHTDVRLGRGSTKRDFAQGRVNPRLMSAHRS